MTESTESTDRRIREQFDNIVGPHFAESEPRFPDGIPRVVEFTMPDGTKAFRYADSAPAPAPAATAEPAKPERKISTRLVNVALGSFIAATITTCLHFAQGSIEALSALAGNLAHALLNLAYCAATVGVVWVLMSMIGTLRGSRRSRSQRIKLTVKGRKNKVTIKQ